MASETNRISGINDAFYKDGDTWASTNSFDTEDIPKVAMVANESYKYLRMRTFGHQTHPNEDDNSGSDKNDNCQID